MRNEKDDKRSGEEPYENRIRNAACSEFRVEARDRRKGERGESHRCSARHENHHTAEAVDSEEGYAYESREKSDSHPYGDRRKSGTDPRDRRAEIDAEREHDERGHHVGKPVKEIQAHGRERNLCRVEDKPQQERVEKGRLGDDL